jgi:hypothetical protein
MSGDVARVDVAQTFLGSYAKSFLQRDHRSGLDILKAISWVEARNVPGYIGRERGQEGS